MPSDEAGGSDTGSAMDDEEAESSGGESSGGPVWFPDFGSSPDGDAPSPSGCTAVDVLFVVDNSASMTSYQEEFTAAFPWFVDAMDANLPSGTSLHVGVTTSSFCGNGNNPPHTELNCVAAEPAILMADAYVSPDEGTVPGDGYQGRLRAFEGRTFFDATTGDAESMAGLSHWFSGAAAVGSSGCNHEFNAAAAGHAFSSENAAANAGFVRDEGAVLLLFILSDEGDQSFDVESLDSLTSLVTSAKAECGGDECIIGAGLFKTFCTPELNAAHAFLSSFGSDPIWGSIGDAFGSPPDYEATVGAALAEVVGQTCDELTPAG